jgi:hypothetical protein
MFRDPAIQREAQLLMKKHRAEAHRIAIKRAINLGSQEAKRAALRWFQVALAVRVIEQERPSPSLYLVQ